MSIDTLINKIEDEASKIILNLTLYKILHSKNSIKAIAKSIDELYQLLNQLAMEIKSNRGKK